MAETKCISLHTCFIVFLKLFLLFHHVKLFHFRIGLSFCPEKPWLFRQIFPLSLHFFTWITLQSLDPGKIKSTSFQKELFHGIFFLQRLLLFLDLTLLMLPNRGYILGDLNSTHLRVFILKSFVAFLEELKIKIWFFMLRNRFTSWKNMTFPFSKIVIRPV